MPLESIYFVRAFGIANFYERGLKASIHWYYYLVLVNQMRKNKNKHYAKNAQETTAAHK